MSTDPRSPMVEAELRGDLPAQACERLHHVVDDRRMSVVEQSVALAAAPVRVDRDRHVEFDRDAPQRVEPDGLQPPPLELRDHALADASARGDVGLAKPEALADGSQDPADPSIIHVTMVPSWARRAIIRRFTRGARAAAFARS